MAAQRLIRNHSRSQPLGEIQYSARQSEYRITSADLSTGPNRDRSGSTLGRAISRGHQKTRAFLVRLPPGSGNSPGRLLRSCLMASPRSQCRPSEDGKQAAARKRERRHLPSVPGFLPFRFLPLALREGLGQPSEFLPLIPKLLLQDGRAPGFRRWCRGRWWRWLPAPRAFGASRQQRKYPGNDDKSCNGSHRVPPFLLRVMCGNEKSRPRWWSALMVQNDGVFSMCFND